MSLRFPSQLAIDNLPDEQLTDQFEVILPELPLIIKEDKALIQQEEGGIASKTGFLTNISESIYNYRPIVEEITFGHMKFSTDSRRVRTGWYHVPKDIESYSDVKLSLFCSSGMLTQYYLESWKSLIYNKYGEYYYPGTHYKKNIDVFIYGAGGSGIVAELLPKAHYILKGCFPVFQDDYKFGYTENPQRFRIPVTFKVDTVIRDETFTKSAVIAELATSPTSILDKGLSSLNSSSTYSMEDTYGGKKSKESSNIINKAKNLF